MNFRMRILVAETTRMHMPRFASGQILVLRGKAFFETTLFLLFLALAHELDVDGMWA